MASFSDYEAYDAVGLAGLVHRGEVTPEELLDAALERVRERNPAINAVVHLMEDAAREQIEALDGESRRTRPLAGVPYLLKDLYVLYRGAPTTNGSRAFADWVADHDSTLTERLREAGLVIFGKTNTPELGLNATTEPVLHGPTRNPWDRERSAGGSSGGAAAAVAAGILPAAHATDGGGSIRIPAAHCAVAGLKVTRARNPAGPDVGEGWSGLSVGHALARTVRDLAALLDATAGPAPGDPYWSPPPERAFSAEVGADPGPLRVALWTRGLAGEAVDAACVRAAEHTGRVLESLGHRVEEGAPPVDWPACRHAIRTIISANVSNALALRGRSRGRAVEADEVETVTWLMKEEGEALSARDYAHSILVVHTAGRRLAAFFEDFDLLLSPTLASPPQPLGTISMMWDDLDRYVEALLDSIPFTPLFNVTGAPAISLPLAWSPEGLPVGVQLGAPFGDEARLLRVAGQLETAMPWAHRRPPLVGGPAPEGVTP